MSDENPHPTPPNPGPTPVDPPEGGGEEVKTSDKQQSSTSG